MFNFRIACLRYSQIQTGEAWNPRLRRRTSISTMLYERNPAANETATGPLGQLSNLGHLRRRKIEVLMQRECVS